MNGRSSGGALARVCLAALLGVALLVALGDEVLGSGDQAREVNAERQVLSEYELLSRAPTVEPTPYWVGRRPGVERFELEKDPRGNLYVRYLTGDTGGSRGRTRRLTVASYPIEDARGALERAARSEGTRVSERPGYVLLDSSDSHSAYVVFEDRPELQIEVFSPRPGQAATLAASGSVTPVRWTPLS